MIGIITIYSILTGIIIIVLAIGGGFEIGLQWINPVIIYNNVRVNWFGCIILTILAHIGAGPWACFYWFYKLCTIGRK